MAHNEITMDMDVKMDLKEKKLEYYQLRTWTKCTVKIEAIKYIPCFVKITLNPNTTNDEKSNIVIKINVPGLAVQLASSRSKTYSYGLFWTQHRKNCCLFFALDSRASLERHINWVQNSVINLEIHRREMLELRRASRISRIDDSGLRSLNTSIDCDAGKCNDTQDIRDINDILGPLPKLPDSSVNWSRRISTTSEIYEEIGDHRNANRKMSRASIVSGIYEVMTHPMDETERMLEEMPPPLPPPRPRVNTQSEINRAYTNPESISSKKRKRTIFETVFSRHKSMQKRKTSKTPKEPTTIKADPMIELIRSHRMSYSSPDLSKPPEVVEVNHYVNEFESDLMARSSATEFSIRNEYSFLNSTGSSDKDVFGDERNISENILSTYNISCNESTVNLVGVNLNANQEKKSVAKIIDDVSGYCQMAPIIRTSTTNSPVSAPALSPKSPFFADSVSHHNHNPVDVTKAITFCRDYEMEASLQNFENLAISKENSQKSIKDTTKNIPSSPSPSDQSIVKNSSIGSHTPSKLNNSFDDKYPSYYPNDVQKTPPKECVPKTPPKEIVQKTQPKQHRKNDGIDYLAKPPKTPPKSIENVYIATPRHGSNRSSTKKCKESTKLVISSPTNSIVSSSSTSSHLLTPSMKQPTSVAETIISSASPHLYHQKYATVAPFMGTSASCKKSNNNNNNNDIFSTKRFGSLPRFKKIDFSPLKLEINSVLQRHNQDQM